MQSEGGVGVGGLEAAHQLVVGQLGQLERRGFVGSDGIQRRGRRWAVAVVLDQHFPQQRLDVVIGAADHDRQFLLGMDLADLQAQASEHRSNKSGPNEHPRASLFYSSCTAGHAIVPKCTDHLAPDMGVARNAVDS